MRDEILVVSVADMGVAHYNTSVKPKTSKFGWFLVMPKLKQRKETSASGLEEGIFENKIRFRVPITPLPLHFKRKCMHITQIL